MICRSGCGACCIAISISSSLPGLPDGKKAGERCIHLNDDYGCRIHGREDRPDVCRELKPHSEMCGDEREEALKSLEELEQLTAPG